MRFKQDRNSIFTHPTTVRPANGVVKYKETDFDSVYHVY